MPILPSDRGASLQAAGENRAGGVDDSVPPISFVVCVSDHAILEANLLASPCLASGAPHEVIAIENAPSAAAGLNPGLGKGRGQTWLLVQVSRFAAVRLDGPPRNSKRLAIACLPRAR